MSSRAFRNTSPIAELKHVDGLQEAGKELEGGSTILENHYRDMRHRVHHRAGQTVGVFVTRVGKRTAAALHIAIEMEKKASSQGRGQPRRPAQLDQLLHPQFDKNANYDVLARGLNALRALLWAVPCSRLPTL